MGTGKFMSSRTYSGTFPGLESSPGCDDVEGPGVGYPKGWSSERVPRLSHRSRRHVGPAALMPLSSGRTLPSKWEDAERWICSPVSLGNISTNSSYCYYPAGGGSRTGSHLAHYRRRAKSKSGPLGPSGPVYYFLGYNSFSPVLGVGVINGGKWRNSLTIDPSGLASARFEERLGIGGGGGGVDASEGARNSCPGDASWLDAWSGPPSPNQDELNLNEDMTEGVNNNLELEQHDCNGDPLVNRTISRRDMATQMFPESQSSSTFSAISSPKSSIAMTSPHPQHFDEPERDDQSPEYEVRDVQVDKQGSATRSGLDAKYINVRESVQLITSSAIIEADNKISKLQREEARINAWENLQKAKAEAAIQKLEEKLEKKRASSMDKIIQKLQRAEIKARKMRSSITSGDDHVPENLAISKTTSKFPSFCKKIRMNSSVRSCSTCYPF